MMTNEPFDEARLADPLRLATLRETGLMDSEQEVAFDRLTAFAQRILDVPMVLISLVDDQRQFFKSAVGLTGDAAITREGPLSHSFCKYVVMSGTPLEVEDATIHPLVCDNPAVFEGGVGAYLGLPITMPNGAVLGSFCAVDMEPHEWTEEDRALLRELARMAVTETALRTLLSEARISAQLLAEARHREIEVGATIQQNLLVCQPPENPAGLSFGFVYRPSERIGGDYSDFLAYDNGCVDVLVGDVMGKGVPAALIAAAAKSHFQRAVRRLGLDDAAFNRLPDPEEIVNAVHAALTEELIRLGSFVTLLYARFDPSRRLITFVDCGHPRILHWRAAEQCCDVLSGFNVPLGLSLIERYRQVSVPMDAGDTFLLYTDGLSEATDSAGNEFGQERLEKLLAALPDASATELADRIEDEVAGFRRSADDDLTCVVVRLAADERGPFHADRGIELCSRAEDLDTARAFVETFCAEHCADTLTETEREMVGLAVHEAVTNIMIHAYGPDIEGHIQLEARVEGDTLRFRLRDSGIPFPPPGTIVPPAFDGSRDSGFGLHIVKSVMDTIERARDDIGRNTLTLTRRLKRDTGPSSE